jgi:hypothetical protein
MLKSSGLARSVAAVVLVAAAAGAVHAAGPNLITNGSFEDGAYTPTYVAYPWYVKVNPGSPSVMPSWNVLGLSVGWLDNAYVTILASAGTKFIDLTDTRAPGNGYATVQQNIATVAGEQYTLKFDLGATATGGTGANTVVGSASAIVTVAGNSTQFDTTSMPAASFSWETKSLTFTALSTTTSIVFAGAAGFDFIGLDNISVMATPVPEPSALALFFAGLAAVGSVVARRSKA